MLACFSSYVLLISPSTYHFKWRCDTHPWKQCENISMINETIGGSTWLWLSLARQVWTRQKIPLKIISHLLHQENHQLSLKPHARLRNRFANNGYIGSGLTTFEFSLEWELGRGCGIDTNFTIWFISLQFDSVSIHLDIYSRPTC